MFFEATKFVVVVFIKAFPLWHGPFLLFWKRV